VHLDAILGNDQLDALFLNVFIYASTCFEQQVLIIKRATTQQPLRTPTNRNNPRDMQQHF
jgi:hypothetical protein